MYAMNIQNDVIGLVLRENCKSKQVIDFIAWPSRCHGRIPKIILNYTDLYVCTQGKKGGGTDILDLICVLNISLLCWFCVSTSSKFQLSITLGKKLHLYEVVLEDNFHYFYVCPLFICQRLAVYSTERFSLLPKHWYTLKGITWPFFWWNRGEEQIY
jgi:hypothetical protein